MEIIWSVLIAVIVVSLFCFVIVKSQLDKIKETIRLNKESNEKDILLANKEISLLDSKLEITNKNIESSDLKLDNLEETVNFNKETSEKEISLVNEDISLLNAKLEVTNKNLESCNTRLDNAAITIKNVVQQMKTDGEIYENQFLELRKSIDDTKNTVKELKNQLAIFTKIEEDSKQLNADSSDAESEISNIELDEEQKAAFNIMNNTNTNMFITGKAGTGKSYLLKYFVKKTNKKTLVMAPTGIAALNAKGVTIHSAFGFFNMQLDISDVTSKNIMLKGERRLVLKKVNTIIIDEISMVRSDILERIDIILKIINNNNLPFGGKQILLFGDIFQLPPIAKTKELEYIKPRFGDKYFFCSNAYKNSEFTFCELTINHRQKDDATFFEILNNIRENNVTENDLEKLNLRTKFESEELRRVIRLFPRKDKVNNINQAELDKIPAKEYVYKSIVKYKKNDLTRDIDTIMPFSDTLKLKLGALVMMVTNDLNKRWVNGTLAIVSHIEENCIKVKIDGYEYEILPAAFEQYEPAFENDKIVYNPIYVVEQYPMVLAYAITIHKSQGMTYKKIACDVSRCFEAGQAYVALSRCTSLEGLYLLENFDREKLGVESKVSEFYKQERAKANVQ